MMKLKHICFYPLKGGRGIALSSALLDKKGIVKDRHWMLVDKGNQFVSQRTHPRLALVEPRLIDDGSIALHAPGKSPLLLREPLPNAERQSVRIWSDTCSAIRVGSEADQWCASFLEDDVQMVFMDFHCSRPVDPNFGQPEDFVSFADGYPILVLNEASLQDLNARLEVPVPLDRFRPNLVVSGAEAFEEDDWQYLRIGEVLLECVKPCARCQVITIDQETGMPSKEPLRTLATYRKKKGKVYFGQNAIPRQGATVQVGDAVTLARE